MQDYKPPIPFKVLLLITAVTGLIEPFVILSLFGNPDYSRMTIASSIGPLMLMGIMFIYKQHRIKKWFLLVLTWNGCYAVSFAVYGIFSHAGLQWAEHALGFAVGVIVHFMVGVLIGGFFWGFSD